MSNENLDIFKISETSDRKETKNIKSYTSSFKKAQQVAQEIENLKKLHSIYAAILNYFYSNYPDEIIYEVYKWYKNDEENLFIFLKLVYPLDFKNDFIKKILNYDVNVINTISEYIEYVKKNLDLDKANLFVDFVYNIIIYYDISWIKKIIDKKNKIEKENILKELYLNIKKELWLNW